MSFCLFCKSGTDHVLQRSMWSCGTHFNDPHWRTKECYKRELNAANERIKNLESALSTVENIDKVNAYQDLESANERIKRMEAAGDAMEVYCDAIAAHNWNKAKEAKP